MTCRTRRVYRHLPHVDAPHTLQFVTFRLADSLPQSLLRDYRQQLSRLPPSERNRAKRQLMETWLDAGIGSCLLARPAVADEVQKALLFFDQVRYRLVAWCIMPNHVHVLLETLTPLPRIVHSWKSYTSRRVGERLGEAARIGAGAGIWMSDYWDRYMRDDAHLAATVAYIHDNPVKAGLCEVPEAWRWSSAWVG